jgi:transposase
MDLATVYRSIVRKHFPNGLIVSGRFHFIRRIHQHSLACWREIDAAGAKHRGLLLLMRRHQQNHTPEQQVKLPICFQPTPLLLAAERKPHAQAMLKTSPNPGSRLQLRNPELRNWLR